MRGKPFEKMRGLNEWAKGKPLGLVMIGQQFATGTEPLFKWLRSIKGEELLTDYITPPSLKEWLSLYKDQRHLEKRLIEIFKGIGGIAEYGANMAELFLEFIRYIKKKGIESINKEWEKLSVEERSEILKEGQRQLEEVGKLHSYDIESDIDGKADEELNKRIIKALKTPEMLFLIKVWAPCFFLYGELPKRVFEKARLGDIDAIEKILRVDPSVIGDQKICEHFYKASWKKDKTGFNIMVKALQRGPKGKITRRRVKYSIAGLISLASSGLGKRLSEPEIKGLFDAVAQDLKNEEIDTSLPYSPEAFSKAIQRYRPKLRPDKK